MKEPFSDLIKFMLFNYTGEKVRFRQATKVQFFRSEKTNICQVSNKY